MIDMKALKPNKPLFWIAIMLVVTCIVIVLCFVIDPAEMKITSIDDAADFSKIFDDVSEITVSCDGDKYTVAEEKSVHKIIDILQNVKISRQPISESRSEDRDRTNTITLDEHNTLCFSYDFSEIWIDDSVEPTFSYSVNNPEKVKKAFEIKEEAADTEEYSQYLNLDAANGLVVYVWQKDESTYSCVLTSRNDDKYSDEQILSMQPTTIEEMREIIDSYNIRGSAVTIEALHDPDSDYKYEINSAYIENLREMLLPVLFSRYTEYNEALSKWIYDIAFFDVDGDGKVEKCTMGDGSETLYSAYAFTAWDTDEESSTPKYYCVFYPLGRYAGFSFVKCDDRKTRLRGYMWDNEGITECLFDIAVKDDGIALYKNSKAQES